jgi:hypothetical protein
MPGELARLKLAPPDRDGNLGLRLDELRLAPAGIKLKAWTDQEEAICVVWRVVIIAPPMPIVESASTLLIVGLHGLARFYQRVRADDAGVLAELNRLAWLHPEIVRRGEAEFRIPSGNGAWRGRVASMNGAPCMALRTFVIPSEL